MPARVGPLSPQQSWSANKMVGSRIAVLVTVLLGLPIVGYAADQFRADTDFVGRAQRSGNQEIGDARDALAMSKDPLILAMAKRIQEDGSTTIQQLAALSVEKGWPSQNLDPPLNTMRHYSDHRYVMRQISAQRAALTFYSQEAAGGSNTALQEFARARLPTIRERLGSMRSLRTS